MAKKFKVYSKKTCVTCKKALAFLDDKKIAYEAGEIEKSRPSKQLLESLVDPANVKASLNSRSAIYKQKNMGQKLPDKKTAIELMLKDPNLIKRPVIVNETGKAPNYIIAGFEPESLKQFLKR